MQDWENERRTTVLERPPERKQENHYFLYVWEHQWAKGRKGMLNSRALKEKGCKFKKSKWAESILNKVFLVPKPTQIPKGKFCPACTLLSTSNVKVDTGCQVSRETSRSFPGMPWGQCLALKISPPLWCPNKMHQMEILTHRIHSCTLGPIWTKGLKENLKIPVFLV